MPYRTRKFAKGNFPRSRSYVQENEIIGNSAALRQSQPSNLKRKYDRQPETDSMRALRAEAARALKRHLGLFIEPKNVTFNAKPFPRKKTIYTWHTQGDLSSVQSTVLSRTICSEKRKFWKWVDGEREIIAHLIKDGTLFPQLYDRTSQVSEDGRAVRDPHTPNSDSTTGAVDSDWEDIPEERQILAPHRKHERPSKRRRMASIELGEDDSGIYFSSDNISQTPRATITPGPLPKEGILTHRQPLSPTTAPTSPIHSPKPSENIDAPAVGTSLSLNLPKGTLRVLEVQPSTIRAPQVPQSATYRLEKPSDIDAPGATQGEGDDPYKKTVLQSIQDMEQCMKQFIDHTTVGYLESVRLRKEVTRLRTELASKEQLIQEQSAKIKKLQEDEKQHRKERDSLVGKLKEFFRSFET
ncbi:hypothetical protein ABW19_dt0207867 [Dactylella cylindrospora]|nr:hypothetical protein ABW19_dt0207867 [Dactylella cylindrospora]